MRVSLLITSASALLLCLSQTTVAQPQAIPASNATSVPQTPVNPNSDQQNSQGFALMNLLNAFELYHPEGNIQGGARLSGSMTMMALGKAWADRFRNFHQKVTFEPGPQGTENGIRELAKDPTLIVGSSRPVSPQEIASLKAGACKDPLSVIVALDPMAIYVNEANPLTSLTPEQLEGVLRAPGQKGTHYATWGELGVTGDLANQPIRIHSRSEVSGTKGFIKQFILRGEEMAKEVESHRSAVEICEAVAKDPAGIGIGGFSDGKPGARAVGLALRGAVIPATEESFLAGQYPLVRPLVLVFDKSQMKSDGGLREEMLRYILSRDGQMEAIRAGFFPLDPSYIHKQLDEICGPRIR